MAQTLGVVQKPGTTEASSVGRCVLVVPTERAVDCGKIGIGKQRNKTVRTGISCAMQLRDVRLFVAHQESI